MLYLICCIIGFVITSIFLKITEDEFDKSFLFISLFASPFLGLFFMIGTYILVKNNGNVVEYDVQTYQTKIVDGNHILVVDRKAEVYHPPEYIQIGNEPITLEIRKTKKKMWGVEYDSSERIIIMDKEK
jgi:phosphate/sulfate permease